MTYLLSGQSDKRKAYIKNLAEKTGIVPQHIYDNDLEHGIEMAVSTQTGLFGDKEIYVLHDLARSFDLRELLPEYAKSENIIIFSEATVTKKIIGEFERVEESTIEDFGKEEKKAEQKLPVFNLADELGRRDKKKLWLLFQELAPQVSAEEIHGILFWQIKNMFLIKSSSTNPGMAPFVFKKNQSYAKNYSSEELQKMADRFLEIFHQRDTHSTLGIELEKIILEL